MSSVVPFIASERACRDLIAGPRHGRRGHVVAVGHGDGPTGTPLVSPITDRASASEE